MNAFPARQIQRSRYLLAITAGLLLAMAFPKPGIGGFAWIAPGLMLLAAAGTQGVESFRIGYVAGLAHHLAALYWLLFIPVTGFPILGWMVLSAFLSLYPATWVWLATRISNFKFDISDSSAWRAAVEQGAAWSWSRRTLWALSCAAFWVALEMVRVRLFGGFPWNLLGASQHQIVPLIQVASICGVYGITFLVAWSSVSLLCAGAVILRRPQMRSVWLGEIILPLAAVVALFSFGYHRMQDRPDGPELRVTLIQPSIPQTLIWNPENHEERFRQLIRLSQSALTNATDLLIWPEAAVPKLLRYDRETFQAITNLAGEHHVWMIVGSDDVEVTARSTNFFNSSFLVSSTGQLADRYCKRSLVIFGEYIPLQRWLPFLKWFTPIQGGFQSGHRPVPFEMPDLGVKTAVLICFEDVFPELGRDSVEEDTDFLVNLTNDGWFGEGAAQWQQAAASRFRAIENGLPLIRCTNNGLTCWFDAYGRLREYLRDSQGSIYGPGCITVRIPLLTPGARRVPTFYHRQGDWLGWGCVAITGLTLVGCAVGIKRGKSS